MPFLATVVADISLLGLALGTRRGTFVPFVLLLLVGLLRLSSFPFSFPSALAFSFVALLPFSFVFLVTLPSTERAGVTVGGAPSGSSAPEAARRRTEGPTTLQPDHWWSGATGGTF